MTEQDLSQRELAVTFTDTRNYFISETSVCRLLKTRNLITSSVLILLKAAVTFPYPTKPPNQLWHTDFTYLNVIGWVWNYVSTVLDDYSRNILAWKLCTTTASSDVTETLQSSGLTNVNVRHRPACSATTAQASSLRNSQNGSWTTT